MPKQASTKPATKRMRNPFNSTKQPAEYFFWKHAGYSYDPKTQTPEERRKECAKRYAVAERWASENDVQFQWEQDSETDALFRDTDNPYQLWRCICCQGDEIVAVLGGIDLGRNGSPYPYGVGVLGNPTAHTRDPYARVVEAELALEAMPDDE